MYAAVVVGKEGPLGSADLPHPGQPETRDRIPVRLRGGGEVLVPPQALVPQEDGTVYLPTTRAELLQMGKAPQEAGEIVVPVVEEEVRVAKRPVQTGGVRVSTRIQEREETVDEPLLAQEVSVERVPVNRVVDEPQPVRYEGNTTIIPLMREELVLQRRLVVKEEVRITRKQTEIREPQQVILRSEEAIIERMEPELRPGSGARGAA